MWSLPPTAARTGRARVAHRRRPWSAAAPDGGAAPRCLRRRRSRGAAGVVTASFDAIDVIRTKRDGGELSYPQIDWVIAAYDAGEVADEAMSALLMAICWRGLS